MFSINTGYCKVCWYQNYQHYTTLAELNYELHKKNFSKRAK